jgi:hypothetical protein
MLMIRVVSFAVLLTLAAAPSRADIRPENPTVDFGYVKVVRDQSGTVGIQYCLAQSVDHASEESCKQLGPKARYSLEEIVRLKKKFRNGAIGRAVADVAITVGTLTAASYAVVIGLAASTFQAGAWSGAGVIQPIVLGFLGGGAILVGGGYAIASIDSPIDLWQASKAVESGIINDSDFVQMAKASAEIAEQIEDALRDIQLN